MKNTKLIQVLSSFDKDEVKQFELFLESPFFNTSEKLLSFYRILVQYYPLFDSPKLDKEKVYKKLHRNAAYNDQTQRELSSSLLKLAKEFIAHRQLRDDMIESSHLRHSWLKERGKRRMVEQEITNRSELLDAYIQRDDNYYYHRWMTDYHEFSHNSEEARDLEHKLLKKKNIDHHLHSLNKYYVIYFLDSYVYLLSMSQIYGYEVDVSLAAYIDTLIDRYAGHGDFLIDLHCNKYKLVSTGEERYYFALKADFLANHDSIARIMKQSTSIVLENYCLKKLRVADIRFVPELFEKFRFDIEHELMMDNGELSYAFYITVITIGLDTGQGEWLMDFKEKYKDKLPRKSGQDVYDYCEAYKLFCDKNFRDALALVTRLKPHNEFAKIDIKNLQARIHYELGMFDELATLLESYPYHLNNKAVVSSRKEANSLFSIFLKQVMDLNRQFSNAAWDKLYKEITEVPSFSHKRWFIDKMEEIGATHTRKHTH